MSENGPIFGGFVKMAPENHENLKQILATSPALWLLELRSSEALCSSARMAEAVSGSLRKARRMSRHILGNSSLEISHYDPIYRYIICVYIGYTYNIYIYIIDTCYIIYTNYTYIYIHNFYMCVYIYTYIHTLHMYTYIHYICIHTYITYVYIHTLHMYTYIIYTYIIYIYTYYIYYCVYIIYILYIYYISGYIMSYGVMEIKWKYMANTG